MQAVGDASATLEKVKIEVRSILLSSKHGVGETEIENDYEMLLCQPLPYKALGFRDVRSLMRAMPDVARIVRSADGEVTYHAVSDESTAHIQKLVSNQKTKKKIKKSGFRGRGRGGFAFRRGGRGGGGGGGGGGGRNTWGRSTRSGVRRALLPLPAGECSERKPPSRSVAGDRLRSTDKYSRVQTETESEEGWDVSADDDDDDTVREPGTEDARCAAEWPSKQSNVNPDDTAQITSPLYNLKIGVGQSGRRVISKPQRRIRDDQHDDQLESTVASRIEYKDLRDVINARRTRRSSAEEHDKAGMRGTAAENKSQNSVRARRVFNREMNEFQRNLPPRFHRRQQQQHQCAPAAEQEVVQNVASKREDTEQQIPVTEIKQEELPDNLEKVYKLLKSNGIWVSKVPDLYQTVYGEPLNVDFLSVAAQWPGYFILEQPAPNRYTVYPVPDALTKKALVNNNTVTVSSVVEKKNWVPVLPVVLPPVGSRLQALFSFAYSAVDVYIQRADMENTVYEIEKVLNERCPESAAPDKDAVVVNCLLAANYEGGWYRAQALAVDSTYVSVCFIDYGNTEKIEPTDLRLIPHTKLTLDTPPLAIKCAVRKSKAGEWCNDVDRILTKFSAFSAVILEHRGDQCVVDLYLPDGRLINDMLIKPAEPASGSSVKFFADDPEPLVIPDSEMFCVYICKVMSENTVLLRIVDDEYSDRLDELEQKIADNFYTWPIPAKIKHSNIYAAMILASADDAEDVDYDEGDRKEVSDQNLYHRVRVIREKKNGSYVCYLPDHGHEEVVNRGQLREIDPRLNASLSYQAVMARLHGLDRLPDKLKPMSVRLLIKILTVNGVPFYALKKGQRAELQAQNPVMGVDAVVTSRVRKIMSCMKDVQLSNIAQIYLNVYGEPLLNVEEVVKNIPGYGYWKESLEIELLDTSNEEGEVNVNEMVLSAIDVMEKAEAEGDSVEDVLREIFSSNTSQADTDSGSVQDGSDSSLAREKFHDALSGLAVNGSGTDVEARLDRVSNYVQNHAKSASGTAGDTSSSCGKALYTWNSKPKSESDSSGTSVPPSSPSSVCDNLQLPKYWAYPLFKFVSVHIVRVESPSNFVGIPLEQRGALEKLEAAITQYFCTADAKPATSFLEDVLYAVKSSGVFRRTLYLNPVEDVIKVFYPDHHSYDTVHPSELFVLPQQFYSLPFLAYRMRLGGIVPAGHDWPVHAIEWFKTSVTNKVLYAVVTGEDDSRGDHRIPGTLVVRLVDTSGAEDMIVDEYMEMHGLAVWES